MGTLPKILATILAFFIFMLLSAALQLGSGPGGRNPGILGLIFLIGLIAAIRAIWKKPKANSDDLPDLNKN